MVLFFPKPREKTYKEKSGHIRYTSRERVSKLDKRKGKREMSPMFVPVVDEETPRSEREKKKKGEKENAHSRFHRTHDKSGETFGSSDVDFREEEQMMDFLRDSRALLHHHHLFLLLLRFETSQLSPLKYFRPTQSRCILSPKLKKKKRVILLVQLTFSVVCVYFYYMYFSSLIVPPRHPSKRLGRGVMLLIEVKNQPHYTNTIVIIIPPIGGLDSL